MKDLDKKLTADWSLLLYLVNQVLTQAEAAAKAVAKKASRKSRAS